MCCPLKQSQRTGVRLLFDAEQSYRQPAVHYFAWQLMKTFNNNAPIVYDTFQMYMKNKVSENDRLDGYMLEVLVSLTSKHCQYRLATLKQLFALPMRKDFLSLQK